MKRILAAMFVFLAVNVPTIAEAANRMPKRWGGPVGG